MRRLARRAGDTPLTSLLKHVIAFGRHCHIGINLERRGIVVCPVLTAKVNEMSESGQYLELMRCMCDASQIGYDGHCRFLQFPSSAGTLTNIKPYLRLRLEAEHATMV